MKICEHKELFPANMAGKPAVFCETCNEVKPVSATKFRKLFGCTIRECTSKWNDFKAAQESPIIQ